MICLVQVFKFESFHKYKTEDTQMKTEIKKNTYSLVDYVPNQSQLNLLMTTYQKPVMTRKFTGTMRYFMTGVC